MSEQNFDVINVRASAITVPAFVQWVVQRHGPQPEEWTEKQYWALVHEYEAEGMPGMSGFRQDGVLATDPPEMVTVERNYMVKLITEGRTEEDAIEEQEQMLGTIAFEWELVN